MYESDRIVTPAQYPKLFDPLRGGEVDLATLAPDELERHLQQHGLFRIGGDRFGCVGAFEDGKGQYKSVTEIPGTCVPGARGYLHQRHSNLPPEEKAKVLRAKVYRAKDPKVSLRHVCNGTTCGNTDPERLPACCPVLGGSREPPSRQKAMATLVKAQEHAKSMLETATVPGVEPEIIDPIADGLLVSLEEVQDGDVVEVDELAPVVFPGEDLVKG